MGNNLFAFVCVCVLMCVCMCVSRFDSRVKAMELDERPTEEYSDIGGLDKQIEEVGGRLHATPFVVVYICHGVDVLLVQLVEAIVLPMTHRDRFENIGIQPPKGNQLHAHCGYCG